MRCWRSRGSRPRSANPCVDLHQGQFAKLERGQGQNLAGLAIDAPLLVMVDVVQAGVIRLDR